MAVIVTQQGSDLSIQQNLVGDGTSLVVSYGTPTATQCRIGLTPSSNLAELAAMTGGGIVVRSNSTGSMNLCTFYSSDSSISINFNSTQANFQLGSTLTGTYTFSNAITLPVNSLALSSLVTAGSTSGYVLTSNGSGVAPTWQAAGGGGGGGLTSVGLGEVSGGTNFNFTNNPLTSNGTITLDIAVGGLPLSRIAQAGATTGQILAWSGSAWTPTSASASSIAVVAPGLSSTTVTGITFTGSGVTGSAAGGIATINIPGGGGGSGLTSVELGNEDGTETILTFTNNPLTSNGTIGIGFAENSLPLSKLKQTAATDGQVMAWDAGATSWNPANWSDIPAAGNVTIPIGSYIDYGTIAIKQVLNVQYLQTYTGANGSGAIYDSQFYPIGGFGGTAGQILSLVTPAAFGSPGTPQVLGWIDKGASTISVIAPGLTSTAVGGITFAGSGVTGSAAGGVATITIPGGGGSGAVSSVTASGGTSVITPTTGAVVLQMDLPLFFDGTNSSFCIGSNNESVGTANFFINGIGIPSTATLSATNNTSYGYHALDSITTADDNAGIGRLSLQSLTTGSKNVGLGSNTGPNDSNQVGACSFMGYNAGSEGAIANSFALGANTIVAQSNSGVLGDYTSPMSVGIGTTTPSAFAQLHLADNSASIQGGQTPTPPALIIEGAVNPETGGYEATQAPNYIGAGKNGNYLISSQLSPTAGVPGSWLLNANEPGGDYRAVVIADVFNQSSGIDPIDGYRPNSLLYTPPLNVFPQKYFSCLEVPDSYATGPEAYLGYSGTGGIDWFVNTSSLAASFLAFGTPEAPMPPAQNTSYVAAESVVTEPTEFTLPLNLPLGSSFRVIGNNPYGWIITSQLGQETNQRICWGSIFALATSSQIAYIQTVGTQFPYLNDSVELVYTLTETDGTQVWTVVNSQGTLDIGTI